MPHIPFLTRIVRRDPSTLQDAVSRRANEDMIRTIEVTDDIYAMNRPVFLRRWNNTWNEIGSGSSSNNTTEEDMSSLSNPDKLKQLLYGHKIIYPFKLLGPNGSTLYTVITLDEKKECEDDCRDPHYKRNIVAFIEDDVVKLNDNFLDEELKQILEEFASKSDKKLWHIKIKDDDTFLDKKTIKERHPNWRQRYTELLH